MCMTNQNLQILEKDAHKLELIQILENCSVSKEQCN